MTAPTSSFSMLLPAARIAVFSPHAETRAVIQSLSKDWRFARVGIEVHEGSAREAIAHYGHAPTPNLLLIDTDVIDESFTGRLEALAGVCTEGTNAIVIGPVNDIALYRYLIAQGVSDYLVRPLAAPAVADVIARVLLEQLGTSDSQLIAVLGAKGGTGSSTVAELLAFGLSEQKQKTILMDMAGGHSYLPVAFGLEPVSTLAEAARAAVSTDPNVLARLMLKVNDHLQILGTGNDRLLEDPITADQAEKLVDRLLTTTPNVIVDLSGAAVPLMRLVLSRARHILLVSMPTLSSLRPARSLLSDIQNLRGGDFKDVHLVINRVGEASSSEIGRGDIEAAIGTNVRVQIPFDSKLVMGSESENKILGMQRGAEKMTQSLLACVMGGPRSDAGKGTGILGGLMGRGKK